MRLRRVVIILVFAGAVLSVMFGAYLSTLYRELGISFTKTEQFIPTRIYSDATRMTIGDLRGRLESRLKSLGYAFEGKPDEISFLLHPIDYPHYLIPENHPILAVSEPQIRVEFDEAQQIRAIRMGEQELEDFYLEPELAATLTRGAELKEVRELVKFEDIPALVGKSIIAIEDQHFIEHKGFDPRGIARAIYVNLKTLSMAQGGSTITQQLVKNLTARRGKDLFKKVNELFLSLMLEARFSKEQILERYLNEVYLGQIGSLEVHGVAEGAKYFFGKRLDELTLSEIALMAGLIRGPVYYSPYRYPERALERQRLVLRKMVETGQIAEAEMQAALEMPPRLAPPQLTSNKAPFFADFVKAELIRQLGDRFTEQEITRAGFRVYTTLDMVMNASAQKAVSSGVSEIGNKMKLPPTERLEGALAAVEHSTGQIRALVGGRHYAQSTFNRILNMKRQVGSTFKPLVYLAAIRKGSDAQGIPYGPGHPAEDAPWKLTYDKGRQEWAPRNYEKTYKGWISYREALAHSVNTVAAKLGYEVGIENIIQTAKDLGIESALPAVPSLALGVAELSPIELLKVYSTFANHGIQEELTVIRAIHQNDGSFFARFISRSHQAVEAGAADLLTDMLKTVVVRGTAASVRRLGLERPAAGKTGTTSDHRDSWFAGYTPELTAVVWVGLDQQALGEQKTPGKKKGPRIELTGSSSALPIWVNFMKEALAGKPETTFSVSDQLTTVLVDLKSGKQAQDQCPDLQTSLEPYWREHTPQLTSCEALWPASDAGTVGF
ncbi:MAG: hypothetical protein A2X97_07625 [Bdellovibrionales bacterium GWA1_52_35]|nr:MAG: hypothetical protein A2X97_07625 [Bdellovibrionales bacterium GWA1_52_35]